MKIHGHFRAKRRHQGGQILPLFALWIVVLIPFVGMSIDLAFAYITKAQLSKAVDAAALAGISNFYLGQSTAQSVATSTFKANFEPSGTLAGRYTGQPTVNVTFSTDVAGNEVIQVQATATIKTFFIRALAIIGGPNWNTMSVGDTGQATRAPVVMTLVLDRSGSMVSDGGSTYLPPAVINFINVFQDNVDKAAVVTFATTPTNDVPMTTPFIAKVTTAANNITKNNLWAGGTFSVGGMTNALAIENSVIISPGQNVIKAVVFFTDGLANMIPVTLSCSPTPWVIGGEDQPVGSTITEVDFAPTNLVITFDAQQNYANPAKGYGGCSVNVGGCGKNASSCCPGVTQFLSMDGTLKDFCRANVTEDATNRVIAVANQMRANGIYVYSIGLSDGTLPVDFLQNVANDPAGPQYNPSMPVGAALITGNGADLSQLFQQIASDIQLRLTH
jgi:Flp pilus assembly protein TadG